MMESDASDNSGVSGLPRFFSKYEYIRRIGSGFCSTVALVRHTLTGDLWACKAVSRTLLIANELLEPFERELRLFEALRHPHVVAFREIVYLDHLICVIMEYCSGGDMFDYIIHSGPIPENRARVMFHHLVDALKYLTMRNVCHRDIKLENVLISDDGMLKLCDFGFSRIQSPNALVATPCGSPVYTAPEIFHGGGYDGHKADVWSLGIVLFAMCVGKQPFRSDNPADLVEKITAQELLVPVFLSNELRSLISHMLDREPARRFDIDDVIRCEWLMAISGEPIMRRLLANDDKTGEELQTHRILASRSLGPEPTVPGAKVALIRTGRVQRPVVRPNVAFVKRSPPLLQPVARFELRLSEI
jgi:serine/threonine protein kinase